MYTHVYTYVNGRADPSAPCGAAGPADRGRRVGVPRRAASTRRRWRTSPRRPASAASSCTATSSPRRTSTAQILRQLLVDLGEAFSGLSFEDVAERGAATVICPVARAHPDAFRLLWRDAWHQPSFADLAEEFRTYVTVYARAILSDVHRRRGAPRLGGAQRRRPPRRRHLQLARRRRPGPRRRAGGDRCRPACGRSPRRGRTCQLSRRRLTSPARRRCGRSARR